MHHLAIKPLSLNSAYRGRRFTTPELKSYKESLFYMLPKIDIPEGELAIYFVFGVSSKNSDGDNLIKCLQDAIAERYNFNDKRIYEWHVYKEDVKKGQEYIYFDIKQKSPLGLSFTAH
jgi:Holliday junction resolvase RusA-like endonuclease